jgi:hypothetical protein
MTANPAQFPYSEDNRLTPEELGSVSIFAKIENWFIFQKYDLFFVFSRIIL